MTQSIMSFMDRHQNTIILITIVVLYYIIRKIAIKLYNSFENEKTEIK